MKQSIGKITVFALIAGLVLSQHASAQKIDIGSTQVTHNIPSEFKITDDMLGGVILEVPDSINLSWDSTNEVMKNSGTVKAWGICSADKKLKVSVPTSIVYSKNDDAGKKVNGSLQFGTSGIAYWSASQLIAGKKDTNKVIGKDIDISVQMSDISYVGDYEGVVTLSSRLENS